jgi:hypothetical protein
MIMSDNEFVTTTAPQTPIQTPENTTMPYDATAPMPAPAPTSKPKRKRSRMTPKQRAAKIAAGWNPPGPRPKSAGEAIQAAVPRQQKVNDSEAIAHLKTLVEKLVALENDVQYRAVWLHYFNHGGVYIGPKYTDELNAAIQYLIGIDNAKTSVGEKS